MTLNLFLFLKHNFQRLLPTISLELLFLFTNLTVFVILFCPSNFSFRGTRWNFPVPLNCFLITKWSLTFNNSHVACNWTVISSLSLLHMAPNNLCTISFLKTKLWSRVFSTFHKWEPQLYPISRNIWSFNIICL